MTVILDIKKVYEHYDCHRLLPGGMIWAIKKAEKEDRRKANSLTELW